ncbi:hypothetical protein BT96DRAFT_916639 [Gymnopus androsaceus JB14]|uniref:Uncharacterized protein n=1 Tax=Gymnopus androsaceus JB14 TaxID=1447944 RepID=A0A6A4I499_9AGAR|nr:hypothetical protein BT96DRAFT_916639 [Gymnopus androsaceus JB14]
MDKEKSMKLRDAYYDMGGKLWIRRIPSSFLSLLFGSSMSIMHVAKNEISDIFIDEWMEKRRNRDQMVNATKSFRPLAQLFQSSLCLVLSTI